MARVFTGGSSQYLDRSAVITGYPYTLAAWVYPTDSGAVYRGITQAATTGISYLQIALRGDLAGDPVEYYVDNGGETDPASASGFTVNAWNFIAARSNTSSDHAVWCNTTKDTSTTAKTFPAASKFSVARGYYGGTSYYDAATSRWACIAVWSVGLSDAEIEAMSIGLRTPDQVRPSGLLAYWPLGGLRPDNDRDQWSKAYDLTATNSPGSADHPRLWYPSEPKIMQASAASTTKYWLFANRNAAIIG